MNYMKKNNLSLSRFTTIKIGGIAESVYFPIGLEGIIDVIKEIRESGKPFFVLGGGSNVIISDKKLDCAVIMTSHLTKYRFFEPETHLEVESGMSLSILSDLAASKSLSGLEFCAGLPGTLGGAVFMNARAYDSEIADLVTEVEAFDYEKNELIKLSKEECAFEYKNSIFQKKPYFIFKIKLNLLKGQTKINIIKKMEDYKFDRKEKGQYLHNSAGCAFKNNYQAGVSSGRIIDELGLKGFCIGGIKVSERHANFLVNTGGGTSQDYLKMVKEIQKRVKEVKGIDLECEVKFLPEENLKF